MARISVLALLLATLVFSACGGGGAQTGSSGASGSTGDAAKGKTVFETKGCVACHTLSGVASATGTTGPTLNGIGTRAATQKPNTTADAYLRESAQNPNAFVVQGYTQGVMVPFAGTTAELNDLVAFLLAQK